MSCLGRKVAETTLETLWLRAPTAMGVGVIGICQSAGLNGPRPRRSLAVLERWTSGWGGGSVTIPLAGVLPPLNFEAE